jgi:signal transduction histidine kinase
MAGMLIAPVTENEASRLQALRLTQLLDTPPEAAFDGLAQVAALLCAAPIALVSLVDESRQWFKACVGLDVRETPRSVSFCAHAIHGSELFVIEDALADPRFADNPLVVGPPNIRFYAGAPLAFHDHMLGTLCVIDRIPRQLTADQRRGLRVLGDEVVARTSLQDMARRLAEEVRARVVSERSLEQARAEAEHAARAKAIFLSNMSHEIRTPMNAMLGFTEVLLRDDALNATQRGHLEILAHAGRHLVHVVNDVLDLEQSLEVGLTAQAFPFDLRDGVEHVAALFRARAAEKGVSVVTEIDAGICAEIVGDERKLLRVLRNLVSNAVKFTPRGVVRVRVSRAAEQPLVRFEVEDAGPGVGEEDMARLFRRYEQSGLGRNVAGGTGLGLAISQELVRAMGGAIRAASTPGGGACFSFEIPLPAASARSSYSARGPAPGERGSSESAALGPARVAHSLPPMIRERLREAAGIADLEGILDELAAGRVEPEVAADLRGLAMRFDYEALIARLTFE